MLLVKNKVLLTVMLSACCFCGYSQQITNPTTNALKAGFINPPNTAKPGVYWYFMDGNMSKESIKKDLESMKKAGIGNLIFLEVNVGVPRGPIDFLSRNIKQQRGTMNVRRALPQKHLNLLNIWI